MVIAVLHTAGNHLQRSLMGHLKNIEAKVWQNGHETWRMNSHFDAPASFFSGGIVLKVSEPFSQKNTQSSAKHTRAEQVALICQF